MPSELLTEREGAVLILTISDPATRNTLSAQVLAAGIESLGVAESDSQVRAVVWVFPMQQHISSPGRHTVVTRP